MKNLRKEDIPVIGSMLFEAFKRNKTDFVTFSAVFDGSFETEMEAAIRAVKDRRRPADVYDKQKKLTIDMYEKLEEVRVVLSSLGEYVKMAKGNLLTLYENYHIKKARTALNAKNVEGVLEHCEQIIDKIINDDAVALDAVGFDAAKITEFETLVSELDVYNTEQNNKMDERQDARAAEEELFVAMFEYIDKVSSVGKSMYTFKQKQKYDDFSISNLKGRINHGRKKKPEDEGGEETAPIYDVMIGRVTDKMTDEPLENVVVRLEGTEVMIDTDEEGEFYLDEIPSGVYTVSFSKRGYVVGTQHNVEVGTSEMADLRVELIEEEGSGKAEM
jgi:Carboxypeptidase regulatory-like domain